LILLLRVSRAVHLVLLHRDRAVAHDCTDATPGISNALVRSCISLSLFISYHFTLYDRLSRDAPLLQLMCVAGSTLIAHKAPCSV